MTYSMDFRRAVAKAYDRCRSSAEVAEQFDCSESWVRRLIQRRRETGSLAPRPMKLPNNNKLNEEDLEQLLSLIRQTPDMTLAELAAALDHKVSVPTIWRATKSLGLSLKKKSLHAAEQDRPDVKEARDAWFEQFAGTKLNQLVFLDEFGAATNMTRRFARGKKGERIVCKAPHGHWKMLSTIAALGIDGIVTACTFDGATDTEMFVAFVEQFLIPKLKPGQIVVMDNLQPHKSPQVDRLIESVGASVMRLPPYSPDFNPIEMAISKIKSLLRKLGRRSVDELQDAIGYAVQSITPAESRNYMTHCGYVATDE